MRCTIYVLLTFTHVLKIYRTDHVDGSWALSEVINYYNPPFVS